MLIEHPSATFAPTPQVNGNDHVQHNNNENTRRSSLVAPQHHHHHHGRLSHAKSRRHSVCSFQDTNLSELRRGRRIHGLQLPLNPLQVIGWITVTIFALATFLVVVPALRPPLQQPALGLLAGLFVVHVVSHAAALLLDPADRELRRQHKSDRIIPEFDRAKHRHVIENGRCHLCNIKTTCPRTKHCSVCNKCVGKFDHHCKWLNHCIGGRNYVSFLMCVVSAVIATIALVGIVITELVLYYCNPQALHLWAEVTTTTTTTSSSPSHLPEDAVNGSMSASSAANLNDTDGLLLVPETNATGVAAVGSGIGVEDTLFLVFISVVGVLATVTAALLIHLCFFHIYISFLGLTTYEYIRNQRQQNAVPDHESGQPSAHNDREERPSPPAAGNVRNSSSNGTERLTTTTAEVNPRRSSIDKIVLCSTVNRTTTTTTAPLGSGSHKSYSHPFRYFVENKVSAAENVANVNAATAAEAVTEPRPSLATPSQCVVCSLMDWEAGQRKSLLCCTKIYNQDQVNIRLGLDVDPEDDARDVVVVAQQCSTNAELEGAAPGGGRLEPPVGLNPNKSPQRWRSKLYCCATVPDSPEVHLDVCNTLHRLHSSSASGSCAEAAPSNAGRVLENAQPRLDSNNIFKISSGDENGNRQCSRPLPRRQLSGGGPVKRYTRLRRFLRLVKFQKNVADGLVPGTMANEAAGAGGVPKINQVRPMSISSAGNLAPSPKRKLRPRADLKGYMEYLSSTAAAPSPNSNHDQSAERPSAESFSPPLNHHSSLTDQSGLRRARKKAFRNHSPKLSPIKESGLSNPASPAPLRNQLFPAIT